MARAKARRDPWHFAEAAEQQLSVEFDRVKVRLSSDTGWTPDALSPRAREIRERRRAAVPVDLVPWAHRRTGTAASV